MDKVVDLADPQVLADREAHCDDSFVAFQAVVLVAILADPLLVACLNHN